MKSEFEALTKEIKGELYFDDSVIHHAMRKVYATDASVYQEQPLAVAIPHSVDDISLLISFANRHRLSLTPRAAGTSLAGQVVGNGIVVDISKHSTSIIELNEAEKWVRVQPGVIRDDLNVFLKPHGLMFGPETSTSNRAMIGGMIGNNSCGLHSVIWGDTRANLLEVKAFLSDGSEVVFKDLSTGQYQHKLTLPTLEGDIYRYLNSVMQEGKNKEAIKKGFPKASVKRRNTGYALDFILKMWEEGEAFNLCQLIAGSEGTLCFITEAKLKLLDLPPSERGIVAVHTATIKEALLANLVALEHNCAASELVDDFILEFTKTNIDQSKNRFFVEGEPRAILMAEFFDTTGIGIVTKAKAFIEALKQKQLGYAYPLISGIECNKVWDLRKSGLGLLRNEPGDTQPVNLIEDCAVDVEDLPSYIDDVEALLKKHHLKYSMYAHAGAGELHVEPMINLKTTEGKNLFKTLLSETAAILKNYGGSLSGEHGDGRLRGEFIPFMMGELVYSLFQEVKKTFDPKGIFNKGKIVDTPSMNEQLRYEQDVIKKETTTVFDFTMSEGILHLAEKCSGSGDCRKTSVSGGTMCPSFMATRSEKDTTRARANMLRHFYTNSQHAIQSKAAFDEVKEVLDLCLSCKACKSECPSSVDVGKMKAEFTQQYHDAFGVPVRSKLIANFSRQMKLASIAPFIYNTLFGTTALRKKLNKMAGFHPDRSMPHLSKKTLYQWYKKRKQAPLSNKKKVYLFCDEFSNYNDVCVGKKTILLLEALGYEVVIPQHLESGRSYLSKGFVKKAKELATKNVALLENIIKEETPLIGIEPSAILGFRDEFIELVPPDQKAAALRLAKNCFLFEEWFSLEMEKGNIKQELFTNDSKVVYVHGHCHQKTLSTVSYTLKSLSIPRNYVVHEIPSGCCGMAGSFGYEQEHFEISMKIGELVLFPSVRKLQANVLISAPGTSCRHQIKDGTGKTALHPAEVLYDALQNKF